MGEQSPSVGTGAVPDYGVPPGALVAAYRGGDPLRVIGHDLGFSTEEICAALVVETVPDDEMERYRSIRRRSRTTMGSIWDNEELTTRLDDSGISRFEIPVVLQALGKEIDVDFAVELLHIPGIPGEDPTIPQEQQRPSDKLSLLYVAGKHHGIEPDYQLALGQVPIDEIIQLRQLAKPNLSPRRLAEILAVAETTKLAVRARVVTSLSVADYAATAHRVLHRRADLSRHQTDPWPVPAATLLRRLGDGCWAQALSSVGLKLLKPADRFGKDDFIGTLSDYTEECAEFDFPLSLEIYDRWVIAEAAVGNDRPSALQLLDRYGSWEAALSEILEPEVNSPAVDPSLFESENSALEAAWVRAAELICELLANMPRNRSLQIQYGHQTEDFPRPYAQGTRDADGIWCEIVSGHSLPGEQWPIDTEYLERQGWLAPDDEVPQWYKEKVPFYDAGHQLLKGLRFGRLCPDPWQLRWSTKRCISGAGPNHGVTMEHALRGTVQTLQNAW